MKISYRNKIVRGTVVFIAIIILAAGYYSTGKSKEKPPLCENGYIDLSGWDFNKNGNVALNGDWEFYPSKLLLPAELTNPSAQPKVYCKVPMRWTNQKVNLGMADKDFGTYRLKVKVNDSSYIYGLKTMNIRTSNKIFVNGKEVGAVGNPAASFQEGYRSNNVPTAVFFPSEENTLDIVIQVANLDYYSGGIIQTIFLGTQKGIADYTLKLNIVDVTGVACLLLSSFYYIGIYLKRKEDKTFILFSAVCTVYSYVIATSDEKILHKLLPEVPFMLLVRLKIALVSTSIIFIVLFIQGLGKDFIPPRFVKMITINMLINGAVILLIPIEGIAWAEKIIFVVDMLQYVLVACLVLRGILLKKYGRLNRKASFFLLGGVLSIILQFATSGLYFASIISSNFVPILTVLVFLIGVEAMFSEEYSKAYSALEDMSKKLIEADKLKDEFLINTSHEFKTPLHGIINITQSILNRSGGEPIKKQEENLSYIVSLATRLSSLVNDIIDFQSLKNRSLRFNEKLFDINGTVQTVIDVLQHMRKGEEIKLINRVPVGKYYVYTDENRFQQIMVNLIGNSLKYTEKGYVEVSARIVDPYIQVSVTDTGIGMSEEAQMELFKGQGYTGEINFTEYTSSGLGLSISKLLASNMGGDLYLAGSKPDVGSTFVIKIPEAEEVKKQEIHDKKLQYKNDNIASKPDKIELYDKKAEGQDREREDKKVKILLADDEASNIRVLQEILYEENYEILVAYNGVRALELLKAHRDISLVLLDVMMPGLSGYEVCRKIRQEYELFEVPILLLTVRNTPQDIAAGFEAGANDFLVKPFDARELKARVRTLQKMKEAVKAAIKMETVFLQSQIKPHFLYNALSVIMSLCYSDGERAGSLLGELSNYLRGTFDIDPHNSLISVEKEISLVKSYVELEKARFGERLMVEFAIEERFLEYCIPALIIQPIVENAIRHGLMKRISGGRVKISSGISNNALEIAIEDNGLGIPPEKLKNLLDTGSATGSVGLKNVNKRLLNEYGQGLSIESRPGEGTKVMIRIPIKTRDLEESGEKL